jgi:predicted NACHT family NTPase
LASFWWLLKAIKNFLSVAISRITWLLRGTTPLDLTIARYRATLGRELFEIRHAWMKEGQKLKDILVPVVVQSETIAGGIEDWAIVLGRYFGRDSTAGRPTHRRLAIIGGPGSGKSVALKIAAREVWNLRPRDEQESPVPIVLTFSEYRRSGFELVAACVHSLQSRGFHLSTQAEERTFVEHNLHTGRLFVIVNALDELERADRKRATDRLSSDL